MARLPSIGSDAGQWGSLLNEFLRVSHHEDGTLRGVCRVVNVLDYGATADGVTDNTNAFTDAIADAIGGVLFFPPGTYVTGKLILPSNIIVMGVGFASILKLQDGTSDALFTNADWNTSNHNIVIRNLHLQGNRENNPEADEHPAYHSSADDGPSHGIHFRFVRDSVIENLDVSDFYFDGIYLGSSDHFYDQDGESVTPDGSNGNIIRNNRITGNGRNGISITRGTANIISSNILRQNNKGVLTHPEPQANPFLAGAIDIEPVGADYDTSRNIVTGNQVIDNYNNGIQVLGKWQLSTNADGEEERTSNTQGILITSNVVSENRNHGVSAGAASHLVIQANYVDANIQTGMALGVGTGIKDSAVYGNIVSNNKANGILVNGEHGERIAIHSNICVANGTTVNERGIDWTRAGNTPPPKQVTLVGNIALNNAAIRDDGTTQEIHAGGADPLFVGNLTGELNVPASGLIVNSNDMFSGEWRLYTEDNELFVKNLQNGESFKLLKEKVQ